MKRVPPTPVGIRWTIGDVSAEGFEALRLSVWGASRVFGTDAAYAVCVNSVPMTQARQKTGDLPPGVVWIETDAYGLPEWLRSHLDRNMAEGVGWKFAPIRVFPDRYEIALDNDCILWDMPAALRVALEREQKRCLLAEDVGRYFGQFADLCGSEARNSGIRGTPAGFELEGALQRILRQRPCRLSSETDEQGLQVAALEAIGEPLIVRTREVSICSPFPPHLPEVGACGAHFVGLNARNLPWTYNGRPASEVRREHWRSLRTLLYERVGIMSDEPIAALQGA
ncbi:MAG: hypothetical protein JWO52_5053 [Gammaproteobacteria bacterium]|jgi:hypothetical protein|nr:hypothetical protein [Gammaproteobacteria bacterium]